MNKKDVSGNLKKTRKNDNFLLNFVILDEERGPLCRGSGFSVRPRAKVDLRHNKKLHRGKKGIFNKNNIISGFLLRFAHKLNNFKKTANTYTFLSFYQNRG